MNGTTNTEETAYSVNFTVQYFCNFTRSLPKQWIVFTGFSMAIYITFVNTILICIFLNKKHISPVFILMAGLAFSDTLASVGIFTPDLLIYSFPEITATDKHMKYPFCLIYTTNIYLSNMFHLLSLVLTTIMCFQKACVIMFPIWGKQHLRNRFSFTSVFVVFVCSVIVYLPRVLEKLLYVHTGSDDICCFKFDRTFIDYIEISSWIVIVVYASSVIIMVTCTVYISCKITVMRRSLQWTDSNVVQKRNKKSAIIVITICIVFLLSESMTFLLWLEGTFDVSVGQYFDKHVSQYNYLVMVFGFALNFEVYIIMSQQMRNVIFGYLAKIFKCCECFSQRE